MSTTAIVTINGPSIATVAASAARSLERRATLLGVTPIEEPAGLNSPAVATEPMPIQSTKNASRAPKSEAKAAMGMTVALPGRPGRPVTGFHFLPVVKVARKTVSPNGISSVMDSPLNLATWTTPP